jgi:hypothetical protein
MGINGAHELSHSVKGLTVQDVFSICSYIRQKQSLPTRPTIDLDASLIYRGSKLSIDNRMKQLVDISCQLSAVGFMVVIICDGATRHHTKRATVVQRQSIIFCQKVESDFLRLRLMSVLDMKNNVNNDSEKASIEMEEHKLSTEIKNLERKLQYGAVDVGQKFYEDLCNHVSNIPTGELGKKGGTVSVIQTESREPSGFSVSLPTCK